jgi:hypothetical protein
VQIRLRLAQTLLGPLQAGPAGLVGVAIEAPQDACGPMILERPRDATIALSW